MSLAVNLVEKDKKLILEALSLGVSSFVFVEDKLLAQSTSDWMLSSKQKGPSTGYWFKDDNLEIVMLSLEKVGSPHAKRLKNRLVRLRGVDLGA